MEAVGAPARRDNVEQIYRHLRDAILDGEIVPGAVMSQVALARELGVSRTPLREALRMLQSEGLIDARANRRVSVRSLTPADLEELCIIRVTLEAEAMRLAVPRLAPEELARLEGHLAEMAHFAEVKDYARWTVPHRSFHRGLTAPAGERVNRLLDQLFDHSERYRRLHIGHGPSPWATASHRQILDACKATDAAGAAGLLAGHLAKTGFDVIALIDAGHDPAGLRQALADAGGELPSARRGRR